EAERERAQVCAGRDRDVGERVHDEAVAVHRRSPDRAERTAVEDLAERAADSVHVALEHRPEERQREAGLAGGFGHGKGPGLVAERRAIERLEVDGREVRARRYAAVLELANHVIA